jgi:S1-C subfamily serine protease
LPIVAAVGALAAVGLLGAAAALGGAWALGGFESGTTTIREVTPSPYLSAASSFAAGKPLSISEIYDRSAPGVVQITSTSRTVEVDPFFGFGVPRVQRGLGSGFVYDKAGYILTNYHVVRGAQKIQVSFSNNDSMKARVVGVDPSTDLAVLKVDADSRALRPLPLGNSDAVKVGQAVVAIGNPLGYDRSVTAGIVSALDRPLQSPNGFSIQDVIQTDAAINQGNSGGPLIDAGGRVIGINTAIATGNTGASGNIGIGFAIPINTVKNVVSELIAHGRVEHAYLGVCLRPIDRRLARLFNLPVNRGLIVEKVLRGGSAARAGLRGGDTKVSISGETYLLGGDLIVKIDGDPVTGIEQLRDLVAAKKPGDEMQVEVFRKRERTKLTVRLGKQPVNPPSCH